MLILLLTILFSFGLGLAAPNLEGKIVGGTNAINGQYPHMISLRKYNRHNCGGSIISKKFIITAAHCVSKDHNDPTIFTVQYGTVDISSEENLVPVWSIYVHKDFWNDASLRNDIALLELEKELEFGPNVQPIKLPTPFETPEDNSPAILAGWGLNGTDGTVQNTLQYVNEVIFSQTYCKEKEPYFDENVQICSGAIGGGKGQCNADSGGPLTVDGKQFGIVSWSIKPCASPDHPGVYAKVTKFRDWIWKTAGV